MEYSFICCWNDIKQLNELLLASYNRVYGHFAQKPFILLIDNSSNLYKCAADAFNIEFENHKNELGEILIFLHQDIAFDDSCFFEKLALDLSSNEKQIIGAAGINNNGTVFSNLKYWDNKKYIVRQQLKTKTEVESIDECCFAIQKSIFEMIKFDSLTCHHWHLYAVDLCYSAKEHCISSFVIPEQLYHKHDESKGLITDRHFLYTMWKIVKKHGKLHKKIYAPCYIIDTRFEKTIAKLMRTAIKLLIK